MSVVKDASKAPTSSSWPWTPFRALAVATVVLSAMAPSAGARAYGGLWSSAATPVVATASAVLFVDNPDATLTAVIQLEYDGPAEEFAWLVPVPSTPTVAVSSSVVFRRLDAATAPEYWREVAVEGTCADSAEAPDAATDALTGAGDARPPGSPGAPVTVLSQGSVEPYDYVEIGVDAGVDDPTRAAIDWLTMNDYDVTGLDADALAAYVRDGFGLLAFKLRDGQDASAIRPVALTYASDAPSIPIGLTAAAGGTARRLLVWIVGPSQAVPTNHSSLVLNDALVDWLSAREYLARTLPGGGAGPFGAVGHRPGNYDALVAAAVDEAGGQGFVTELAGPASQYRDKVWAPSVDEDAFAALAVQRYDDGIDALVAAHDAYGSWDGWRAAVAGAATLPPEASLEALASDPAQYRGVVTVDAERFLELLEDEVVRPVADTAAMLERGPYLTRLYTRLSPQATTPDPAFDYNLDLAQVSNIHIARQLVECDDSIDQADAPWRIETAQGGLVVGEGVGAWPIEVGSMPANLAVVMLSATGMGTLVEDNRDVIARQLRASGGATTSPPAAQTPHHGVAIGGNQTVRTYQAEPPTPVSKAARATRGTSCSATYAEARRSSAVASGWPLLGVLLSWRRRGRGRRHPKRRCTRLWACLVLVGCGDRDTAVEPAAEPAAGVLTLEQLRDPETCKDCHPVHYREWSSSMHAYAARDPVFLAMNRRGQRETRGKLGNFCVRCHAPMAVVDGLTDDGLNLEELPDLERGVSCYFCHNVEAIEGDHNAQLRLANDRTMRGPIDDPLRLSAHGAEHSDMFEDRVPRSSAMCGACHDIVTQSGVRLERTFQEYLSSVFSKSAAGEDEVFDSCVGCHMPGRSGFASSVPGAPQRKVHEHLWPGIDLPLIDFPRREAMRSAVESCQLRLSMGFFTLEVTPPDLFTFQLETSAGHNQPSGAAQDRRMWLEFLAYDEDGRLLEDVSSGNIADDAIEEAPEGDADHDPHLFMLRDRIYGEDGEPVNMFWDAAKSPEYPDGYASHTLPPATTTYVEGKHAVVKQYRASGPNGLPARVTARLRIRPIGLDVLQDLVDSGDLAPEIMAEMQTLTLGSQIEWTPADGVLRTIRAAPANADCKTYVCLLDASAPECADAAE